MYRRSCGLLPRQLIMMTFVIKRNFWRYLIYLHHFFNLFFLIGRQLNILWRIRVIAFKELRRWWTNLQESREPESCTMRDSWTLLSLKKLFYYFIKGYPPSFPGIKKLRCLPPPVPWIFPVGSLCFPAGKTSIYGKVAKVRLILSTR